MDHNLLKNIRWKQRFENFEKAYRLLYRNKDIDLDSEIERAGLVQFFEMTFELSWKVMKDYLEYQGYIVKSPREVIKTAYQYDLVDNGEVWIVMLMSRNNVTHQYEEEMSEEIASEIIEIYLDEIKKLYEKLKMEIEYDRIK